MRRLGLAPAAACLLALAASAAGASTSELPPVALSASPSQLVLLGRSNGSITVANRGGASVALESSSGSFTLDRRGRIRFVARPAPAYSAARWLRVSPRRVVLRSGGAATFRILSRPPRRAEPGDHHAVVLLTTGTRWRGGVAVRMRVGVVVLVRVPGRIVRRLELRAVRVRRRRQIRVLEVTLLNRGNVSEQLPRGRVSAALVRGGRVVTKLAGVPRTLLPRTLGVVEVPYAGRIRGRMRAVVRVEPLPAALAGPRSPELPSIWRRFRIRL